MSQSSSLPPSTRNDVLRDFQQRKLAGVRTLRLARWDYVHVAAHVLGTNVRRIAEIGVGEGEGARNLRRLFVDSELHLVDPWLCYEDYKERRPPSQADLDERRRRVHKAFGGDGLVTVYQMTSEEAASQIAGGFDIVFIDANHAYEYVKQDIRLWRPKVRSGGFLAGHDYLSKRGVRRAVDELLPGAVLPDTRKMGDVWAYAE